MIISHPVLFYGDKYLSRIKLDIKITSLVNLCTTQLGSLINGCD